MQQPEIAQKNSANEEPKKLTLEKQLRSFFQHLFLKMPGTDVITMSQEQITSVSGIKKYRKDYVTKVLKDDLMLEISEDVNYSFPTGKLNETNEMIFEDSVSPGKGKIFNIYRRTYVPEPRYQGTQSNNSIDLQRSVNGLLGMYEKEELHSDLDEIFTIYSINSNTEKETQARRLDLIHHLQKYLRTMQESDL